MADKPASADAAALPAGYRIHEYEIERPLGGGGFGITYLARDANLDLPVAIKEYFPSDLVTRGADQSVSVRAGNAEAQNGYDWGLERFLDEARALATFRHPNIVRALRYFKMNGTAYIVMEYESGLSLKRWVPQNAPLSQRSVLSIVRPLLDGLEQVHKAGFLHRDIKPDNIYVRADGTPVLLDFGAARRVNANRDMTNIVSPGFAPFEQYHSQGNQGPWTDVYSIGAVMYWMVTGKKPMESASRVKTDGMLPASSLAEASTFGLPLLRAIEWAMTPDEAKRPQTVALFRDAIQGPEVTEGGSLDVDVTLDARGIAAAGHAVSTTPSQMPSQPTQRRNLLGTILFMDLVGYSVRSVDDQAALKKLFNELTTKALRGVPEESRIAIDTGDGAAICFMGDPEEALHSALLMRDLLGQRYGHVLSLRIGLHMGPLRLVSDINGRNNVVGDGINVAQRVMDFAQPNQVLVSRSYYDVISRITDDTAGMFRYLGHHEDKHGRKHEVYAVDSAHGATQRVQGPATGYTRTAPMAAQTLNDDEVHEIEAELARHIGPLAKTLVNKARPRAANAALLREALAPSIQESRAREAFINGGQHHPASRSQPVSGRNSGPPSVSQPLGRSGPSASVPWSGSGPSGSSSVVTRSALASSAQVDLSAEELAKVEATLSKFIGPMARMLVKKELGRARNLQGFIAGVADTIDQSSQRKEFLKALQQALPKRKL